MTRNRVNGLITLVVLISSATGTAQVEVTNAGGTATASANLQTYSPGFFTFNNKYPAAVHLDRTYVAPVDYFGAGAASRPVITGP